MDGLMTVCHDARKGRTIGSHWPNHVAPPLHSTIYFPPNLTPPLLSFTFMKTPDPMFKQAGFESQLSRRRMLANLGTGLLVAAASGAVIPLTAAEARKARVPLNHFTPEDAGTLEAFGDALLPGAAEAGVAHYIDDQLGHSAPLLFLQYMDYPGPADQFYKTGLAALNRESVKRFGNRFPELKSQNQSALIGSLAQSNPSGWDGPPAPLFCFVLRNDACDVYYGTEQGFKRLGIPYMPHIAPPQPW